MQNFCTIRLEISLFYINNLLKVYINCVRVLSDYKRPKDIKKYSVTAFKMF